ncbi:helix-turn-helix domain-containing protein [Massilia sp. ST3]|uniref:helix-turn-helix domain-containing protein n=1 Tax=Massilia sp. ST3 TaxID=2824903 RepID=UPI001B82E385|nr:helix-turn-helix domain-containing protein [Massilia sp. ST3]MBQ5947483.1 DUF4115 domain-containing protein [Massilia sp. ST3]
MNEHADQPGAPDNPSGNPGKTLQTQREAMGWTVEQVADQLKLAPRQVVALEAGDFASLPSPAVTRGFVRAYAKLLKIDAAPLVSMIELNMPPQAQAGAPMARREQRPAAFNETRFPIGGKRTRLPLGWIAAVLVVGGVAAAAWQLGVIPGSRPAADANPADGVVLETPGVATPGVAAPATNGAIQAPLNNPSVPLISVPAPAAEGTAPAATGATPGVTAPTAPPATTPTNAPVNAPVTTAPAGAAPAPATVPPAAPAAAPAAAAPAAAAGANTLVLNVREDSWIEVRPAGGGRPLLSRLVKAGSTETLELTQPVNLVVGAPSGVSATLRGASVALPQVPGKTIARVSLK